MLAFFSLLSELSSVITTNPIESMFSLVRQCEKNIKRPRGSAMLQRWLGSVLLYCEGQFNRVRGYQEIDRVITNIDNELADQHEKLGLAA